MQSDMASTVHYSTLVCWNIVERKSCYINLICMYCLCVYSSVCIFGYRTLMLRIGTSGISCNTLLILRGTVEVNAASAVLIQSFSVGTVAKIISIGECGSPFLSTKRPNKCRGDQQPGHVVHR